MKIAFQESVASLFVIVFIALIAIGVNEYVLHKNSPYAFDVVTKKECV